MHFNTIFNFLNHHPVIFPFGIKFYFAIFISIPIAILNYGFILASYQRSFPSIAYDHRKQHLRLAVIFGVLSLYLPFSIFLAVLIITKFCKKGLMLTTKETSSKHFYEILSR